MKKALAAVIILSLSLSSCKMLKKGRNGGKDDGQIVGKKSTTWTPQRPKGMVPVPSGSFVMGQTDYDFTFDNSAPVRTVTVSGFFMDDTEVTNSKYHVFVDYVRDSIARTMLAEKAADLGFDPTTGSSGNEEGIAAYKYVSGSEDGEPTPWDDYVASKSDGREGSYNEQRKLNWNVDLAWNKYEYPDVDYAEAIDALYYPPEERFNDERLIDVRKLKFKYTWIDQESAAKEANNPDSFRVDFRHQEVVPVYPDTTVWVRDFNYAYNDPMHENYFWHDAYSDYPVVGVNWNQAMAYCAFRTKKQNDYLATKRKRKDSPQKVIAYRLPNEIEWEYAARGGLQDAPYPWGGPYLTDDRGCYLANFKPKRGDYIEEEGKGYMYTAPVKTFHANGYGLYDMAGNVGEWTVSPYDKAFYQMSSTLNPTLARERSDKKSVRGGSWKDIGYMLMVSARDWEHKDSARSFIGFRTVQSFPEGSKIKYRKKRTR